MVAGNARDREKKKYELMRIKWNAIDREERTKIFMCKLKILTHSTENRQPLPREHA